MNRLAHLISQAGRQYAAKTAIIYGDQRVSFAAVEADSNRLASALVRELGVPKGARVGILLPNRPEFTIADWALIKAGLVRIPLNPRLAPPEIAYILNDAEADVVIYGGEYTPVIEGIRPHLTAVRHCIAIGAAPDGALAWAGVLSRGEAAPFQVATEPADPYMLMYTSGTTGHPKGAIVPVGSRWLTLFTSYANEDFVRSTDVMLHVASLAHGSGTKVLNHYVKGATNVYLPKFTVADFCQAIQDHRVTTTWLVPTVVGMLLDFPDRHQYDLSSLRTVVYAGAPMPAERLKEALQAFGPIFVQVYGLTEAPHPALSLAKEDHIVDGTPAQTARLASAGRPSIGVDTRVVTEDGRAVEPGEIGEIVIRGENVMTGYWRQPEATAEVLRDGWFHTGDLATVDDEGYVFIVDRKKDLIISGGYNVYPREVEEVLYQHPAVRECAVIGVPDAKWGEAVKAVLSLRPGTAATAEELMEHCRQHLAGYKKPQTIDIIDDLPKNPNGKILKKELRQPYWEGRQRMV